MRRYLPRAACRFVVWCLLVAVPVFGLSGTLVELLGAKHVHRVATATLPTGSGPVQGWVDMRRASTATLAPHAHSHERFARHHHEHADASVVALDGSPHAEAADDDGGGSAGSFSHAMALTDAASFVVPPVIRRAWLDAAGAAAVRWTADGPMRPPKT